MSDIKLGAKINALVKGEPGSGKTVLEGSFPKPMYIFDLDHKVDAIKKMELELGKDIYSSEGIEYDVYGAMDYPAFKKKFDELENYCPYKTVVVDSLTTLADMLVRYSLSERGNTRREEGNKSPDGRKRGVILLPEFEEFNVESLAINQVIDIGRNLRAHFLLSAHVLRVSQTDNSGRQRESRTLMTAGKKIAAAIPAKFKEQWHVEVDSGINAVSADPDYIVCTKPTGIDFAASLLPLPSKINFTKKNFYKIIEEELRAKGIELSNEAKELKEEDLNSLGTSSLS